MIENLEVGRTLLATQAWEKTTTMSLMRRPETGQRCLLWIDSVGAYLACWGPRIVLGHAHPDEPVEVPILGQISSRHAAIRHDGENFLVEARRPTWVNDQPVHPAAILTNHSTLRLGENVEFRFRQPHPFATSGRLDLLSRHQITPTVDAVLLWSDSIVLGPNANSHVICPDWTSEVVLFKRKGQLWVRGPQGLKIDDVPHPGKGQLGLNSRVEGEDFSFTLEAC